MDHSLRKTPSAARRAETKDLQERNGKDADELDTSLQGHVELHQDRHGQEEDVKVHDGSDGALHDAGQGEFVAVRLQLDQHRGPGLARVWRRIDSGQRDVGQVGKQDDEETEVDGELELLIRREELQVQQENGGLGEEEDGREQDGLDKGQLEEACRVPAHRNVPRMAERCVLYRGTRAIESALWGGRESPQSMVNGSGKAGRRRTYENK